MNEIEKVYLRFGHKKFAMVKNSRNKLKNKTYPSKSVCYMLYS